MTQNLMIIFGLFILAIVSGMLGLGVAFAAVPFLSLFMPDLIHQVQPLTLMLNGLPYLPRWALLAAAWSIGPGYPE